MNKNKKTIIQTSKKIFMQISLGSFLCVIVILILFNPFYSSWNSVNNYSSSTSNNVVAVENTPKEAIPPISNGTSTASEIGATTATIDYDFNPGQDEFGVPYEITEITLTGTGITNNYNVEEPSPHYNDDFSSLDNGTARQLPTGIITVYSLEPSTYYDDWVIHASFTDDNTYDQIVEPFSTLSSTNTSPSPNGDAKIDNITNTTAIINYSFSSGGDENNDPYEVTNVTLSGTGITNNYTVGSTTAPIGIITLQDLDPNTTYDDLIVHVTFTDNITYEQTVDPFSTLGFTPVSPSPNETATVTEIDTTIATINYSFDPGSNENGDPYTVTNVTLSGTGITDNYIVESPTSPTGTITLQDLEFNTSYDDLIVAATFTDGNIYNQNVDPFSTLGLTPVNPGPNETATVTEIDTTIATINYSFNPGSNENGDPYTVTNVTLSGTGITDNYIVESPTSPTGTIALQDLELNTSYDDLIVSATFTDGNIYNQNVDQFNTLTTITSPNPNETATTTNIIDTKATINYSFSPGNDEYDIPYEITQITLSGTGITDNYIVESPSSPTGTITLKDLDPETVYSDLIVSATFTDGNTYEQDVDTFTTQALIIPSSPDITKWIIISIVLLLLIVFVLVLIKVILKIIEDKKKQKIN